MNPSPTTANAPRLTARELRRLPAAERDALLQAAAAQAEHEYRTNRDLTAFEAFEDRSGNHEQD